MSQRVLYDFLEEAPAEARLREFDADHTPRGVVRQGLLALLGGLPRRMRKQPIRVLDIGAGYGVYGSVWRELRPNVRDVLIAIEAREECVEDLRANGYDEIVIARFQDVGSDIGDVDVSIGNPPFSEWTDAVDFALAAGELAFFLGSSAWGHAQEGWPHTPEHQYRVSGRVKFRGPDQLNPKTGKPYGADMRDVSHWEWSRHVRGHDLWLCHQLPPLPPEDRTWTVLPGTEWRYR